MVKVHYQESMKDPMGEYTVVLLREILLGQAGMSYFFFLHRIGSFPLGELMEGG